MFDLEIVMDSLQKISKAIDTILERASVVSDPNELLTSPRYPTPWVEDTAHPWYLTPGGKLF